MQLSSQRLNKTIEEEIEKMLHQVLVDIEDRQEMKLVLDDLLTKAEKMAVAKRLAIALYLDKGRSYENIKLNLKVSSATIAAVAETMGNPGMQLALQQVKAEEWAEEWSQKIAGVVRKVLPR